MTDSDNNTSETEQYEYLLDKPNVVAVSVEDDGQLIVYVTQKIPEDQLPDDAIVSQNVEDDRDSDVREAGGEIRLHANPRDQHRPIKAGVSEGPATKRIAGTGGPIAEVEDPNNPHLASRVSQGDQVRVSNCHVYANSRPDGGQYGDPITQPARLDGGSDRTILGPLIGYRPMSGEPKVDAAVRATSSHDTQGALDLPDGYPESIRRSYEGMVGETVTKSGRTTGTSSADVEAVGASIRVRISDSRTVTFRDQIIAGHLSEPGDSGSPVFDSSGRLFGLLFAGSSRLTVLNKIANVETALGIRMIDGPLRPDAPEEPSEPDTPEEPEEPEEPEAPEEPSEPDTPEAPDQPQILKIGPGTNFASMEYSFAVEDGASVEFSGKSSTKVDNRVNAWCSGWTNRYEINGTITDVSIPEGAHVELNGERVDHSEIVDRSQSIAATSNAET